MKKLEISSDKRDQVICLAIHIPPKFVAWLEVGRWLSDDMRADVSIV